jgi:hypothetical protein
VYDLALSEAEVLANYNATKGDLQPSISISDATAIEGSNAVKFLDTFVQSGSGGLSRARGMAYGNDGNLYVVSADTNSVLRFNASTGQFIDVFVPSGSGGLDDPWAMAFGPDGNVYVTSLATDNVLRFDGVTGAFIDQYVATGVAGLKDSKDVLFGPDGHLYVSNSAAAGGVPGPHEVLRFQGPLGTSPGAPLPAPGRAGAVFVSDGSGGLNNPNGLAFGPDAHLYVANTFGDSINRYNSSTGAFLNTFVSANSGGLDVPSQIQFRPDGFLYVTSQATDQVLRYNAVTGSFVDAVVTAGSDGLDDPNGLLFDTAGNMYVASMARSSVLRFGSASQAAFAISLNAPSASPVSVSYSTAPGTATASDFTAASGTITFAPGQTNQTVLVQVPDDAILEPNETFVVNLSNPVGGVIADSQGVGTIIDNDTKFYVVNDATQNRTYEYGPTGQSGDSYNLASGNAAPRGAATTAAGDKVWVVDANRNVYVYNTSGGMLGSWTARTLPNNATIEGIATNGTDVWIVDARGDRVYRYAGAASRTSGSQFAISSFRLDNGNSSPKDIVTDGQHLWVVNDSSTDRVFKYTIGGSLVGSWTIDPANRAPTGITLDPASPQHIWIVDSGTDRVYQYNSAAGRTSGSQTAATSFALAPGNTNPQGIADPPATLETVEARTTAIALPPTNNLDSRQPDFKPRPRFSFATQALSSENLSLLTQTDRATQPTTGSDRKWQPLATKSEAVALDAAIEDLDFNAWPELLIEL